VSEPRDWDARTYDRVSDPQVEWALAVLERLPLEGDETVLDAGCGSGRVTRLLLERLPRGRVIAVDAAPSMVEEARAALGGRADVRIGELTRLELGEGVDAVFSNAVFHWIADHDALFRSLHAALRHGGKLVAQCGGAGNVERFHQVAREVGADEPFAAHLAGWEGPWNFATAEDTHERLERAGFVQVECRLTPWPVRPPDPLAYLRTVCLGHHLERLPPELRAPFVERVAERCAPSWETEKLTIEAEAAVELDYVRLDLSGRRA